MTGGAMHPGMAKEGVGASLADPPNLVIPANFSIFTVWGEKSVGIEPA
jgi:hypothetical protein